MNFAELFTKIDDSLVIETGNNVPVVEEIKAPIEVPFSVRAKAKIEEEYASLKTKDKYSSVVSEYVKSVLIGFIEQDELFARIVLNTKRTFSDVLFECFKGFNSNHISDIDVYRNVVKNYCPDSDVHMIMSVKVSAMPSEDILDRETEYPKEPEKKKFEYTPPKPKTPEEIEVEKKAAEERRKEEELKKKKEKIEKAHPGQTMFFDLFAMEEGD